LRPTEKEILNSSQNLYHKRKQGKQILKKVQNEEKKWRIKNKGCNTSAQISVGRVQAVVVFMLSIRSHPVIEGRVGEEQE